MPNNPITLSPDGSLITTQDGSIIDLAAPRQNEDIQVIDYNVEILKAILWEYNDAANLQALLEKKSDWLNENQSNFWFNWIYNVFDLRTANEFGCAVWSIILQLPLFQNSPPDPIDKPTFGFDASYFKNFNRGNFSSRDGSTTQLSLETKRLALRLRYFQLVTSGTVPEINRFLKYLFGSRGNAFLVDNHDMTQTYVFNFQLTAEETYLFSNFDILPRPATVGSTFRTTIGKFFGFGPSSNRVNFNRGGFQS